MTRKAVLICPGRGTYNKSELGYLQKHHREKTEFLSSLDAIRKQDGQETVASLDGAQRFSAAKHTRGDIASPLIYACTIADSLSLADDIEIVAVTGNSMGWYTALAAAGATSHENGFRIVNAMGTLMQEHLIGGQTIYPFMGKHWQDDQVKKQQLLDMIADINRADDRNLCLSIDLGGMLVVAGDEAGLGEFEKRVPRLEQGFPMRLPNHAAFHSHLQKPVAELGRNILKPDLFRQPILPLVDGRGFTWWPDATDLEAMWDYTLGAQVIEPYNFSLAIKTIAREFAPELFIITGPGTTLGGAVAQSLILAQWQGMKTKKDFQDLQADGNFLISMGLETQRDIAVKSAIRT